MHQTPLELIGAALFAVAIVHTLSTKHFEHLAHTHPRHAGLWHLLGEVEVVFGFWALVLAGALFAFAGSDAAKTYFDTRTFTEPLFVFAVMVIAGTRPIRQAAQWGLNVLARRLPNVGSVTPYFLVLSLPPLCGSLITEPAAMTLAALILAERFFARGLSERFKYGTLAVLFVNVSIGGTLTAFAAPPVLMVAHAWHWDTAFMLTNFGWKAAVAVGVNALAATLAFRRELTALPPSESDRTPPVPLPLTLLHFGFLAGVVIFSHHPPLFLGLFLFFLGLAQAYKRHQDQLILREGLLVAFFLAGLVVLGGMQQWWLQPLLTGLDETVLFFGTAALTAIADNSTLTYLGSLVEGISDDFKYALVAGAVAGGGLTIIANAPNPAGIAILRAHFNEESVSPLWLMLAALPPTAIAAAALWLL